MSLSEIAFPYKRHQGFGVASFSLLFVLLFLEIEVLALVGLAIAGQLALFVALQQLIAPAAALVALAAASVFAWRARKWTKSRMASVQGYSAQTSGYAERLAQQHRSQG